VTVEIATAEERCPERFEVSGTDTIHPGNGVAAGFGDKPGRFHHGVPTLTADRRQVGRRGAAHARNGAQMVQHLLKTRRAALLRIVGVAQIDVHQEDMIGVKARIDGRQLQERVQQQAAPPTSTVDRAT